jgi:argininosuccinate lyase
VDGLLVGLQRAFLRRCRRDEGVILPGYTHLQRAQPVLAAHYWLAYCEKLERDRERLRDCRRRVNVSPLGAAALAGSSLPIDRADVARRLGFEGLCANSLDASSDRDFVLESAFCLSLTALHLSGWAEEWILWSTAEFDFLRLSDEYCTGSSIMPQKVNPDVLELIRGKSGRVVGNLQALMMLIKGLPLAYNRDLQEDKRPLFEAFDTVVSCLELAALVVESAELRRASIEARLEQGYLDATTLMEELIRRGTAQRAAHHLVGKLVRIAMRRRVPLSQLTEAEWREADPALTGDFSAVLGVHNALAAFRSVGSTSPRHVAEQVLQWQRRLEAADGCDTLGADSYNP